MVLAAKHARQRWPATCGNEQACASHASGTRLRITDLAPHAQHRRRPQRTPTQFGCAPEQRRGSARRCKQRRQRTETPFPSRPRSCSGRGSQPQASWQRAATERWRSRADAAALRLQVVRLRRSAKPKRLPSAGAGTATRTDTSCRACFSRDGTPLAVRSAACPPLPRAPTFAVAA